MGSKTSIYIPDELKPLLQKYVDRHGSLRAAIINSVQSIDTMYKIERRALRDIINAGNVPVGIWDGYAHVSMSQIQDMIRKPPGGHYQLRAKHRYDVQNREAGTAEHHKRRKCP
jgi:hypothetical protein